MGNRSTAGCGNAVVVCGAAGEGDVIVLWSGHCLALLILHSGMPPIRSRHARTGDECVINLTGTDELLPSGIVWSPLMAVCRTVAAPGSGPACPGGNTRKVRRRPKGRAAIVVFATCVRRPIVGSGAWREVAWPSGADYWVRARQACFWACACLRFRLATPGTGRWAAVSGLQLPRNPLLRKPHCPRRRRRSRATSPSPQCRLLPCRRFPNRSPVRISSVWTARRRRKCSGRPVKRVIAQRRQRCGATDMRNARSM